MEERVYIKRKQTTGIGGQFYEIKLTMWFLLRALEAVKNNTIDSFQIGSNVEFAGDFDDILFRYEKGKKIYVELVQAKHRDNPEKTFTLEKFFADSANSKSKKKDYDLKSYLKSYESIANKFFNTENPVHKLRVIFFTNSMYYGNYDKKFTTEGVPDDDVFFHQTLKDDEKRFKINCNERVYDSFNEKGESNRDLIDDFMNNFQIWCSQPNEEDFGEIIKNKIKSMYSTSEDNTKLIYNDVFKRVVSWWKLGYDIKSDEIDTGNAIYLNRHDDWFRDTYCRLAELTLKGGILFKSSESNKIHLRFKSEATSELIDVIDNSRMVKINVSKKIKELTDMKIYQSLENVLGEFIFLTIPQLIKLKDVAIGIFSGKYNLLVIDFVDGNHQIDTVYEQLKLIMNNDQRKKIVLIAEEQQSILPFECEQTFDMSKIFYEDLDEDSQMVLLNQEIFFQGNEIKLNEILTEDSTLNEDMLVKLVMREKICIGRPLQNLGKVFNYHIDRTLIRQIGVKDDFLWNGKDLIAISGITKEELCNKYSYTGKIFNFNEETIKIKSSCRVFIVRNENDFQILCLNYNRYSIHWLTIDSNCESGIRRFVWIKSQGSITNLKTYLIIDQNKYYSPNEISRSSDKLVIIAAEPGMGKTTFLSSLAHDRQELKWRGRMNLSNDYKILNTLKIEEDSIFDYVCTSLDLNTDWERQLFKQYFRNKGGVELMFDGYDEIAPIYTSTVIEMIKWLRDNTMVDKLWITTRLSVLYELESGLDTLGYRLKPFTDNDAPKFLLRFWGRDIKSTDENKAKSIINVYFKKFTQMINDETKMFIGIPLQLEMLANVLEESFIKQLNSEHEDIERLLDIQQFNIYSLYKSFIKKKIDVIAKKKKMDFNNAMHKEMLQRELEEFESKHINYAFISFFDEETLKIIINEKELMNIQSSLNDILIGREKNGLINDIIDGKPNFIHRTFTEFFIAAGLVKVLEKPSEARKVGEFLQQIDIFSNHRSVIRSFFDHSAIGDDKGGKKMKFFNAAIVNNVEIVSEMLTNNEIDVNCKDMAGRTALHLASSYNHHEIAELLINHRVDISIEDKLFNLTALRYANMSNYWKIVELLLKNNADPKQLTIAFGNHQLRSYFCEMGFINLVRAFIRSNSSWMNIKNNYDTSLYYAASNGHSDVVALLLSSGEKATYVDHWGNTPLHEAVEKNRLDVVKVFISLKPKLLNAKNNAGKTPLLLAVLGGYTEIALTIIKANPSKIDLKDKPLSPTSKTSDASYFRKIKAIPMDVFDYICNQIPVSDKVESKYLNEKDDVGRTPLYVAINEGHQEIAIALIKANACDVNEKDAFKRTPLHYASITGSGNVISQLLASGAHPFVKDKEGYNPLHLAVIEDKLDAVKVLVDIFPVYLNEKDSKGRTPLFIAIYEGHLEMAIALTKRNISEVNKKHRFERTSLHHASINGWANVISNLLKSGADAFLKDYYGYTPLHLAVIENKLDAVKIFINVIPRCLNEKDNNERTPLLLATKYCHQEIALALINANKSVVNGSDTFNWTPLHYASFEGLANVISQLLISGANAFAKDNEGYSPLHLAVIQNKLDAVNVFIDEIPECLNEKDSNGMTPLLLALHMEHQEIAIAFIKSNATLLNETDILKRTPLHYASIKGFGNVITQLLTSDASVFAKDYEGYTPLHLAVIENKLDAVKAFMNEEPRCLYLWDSNRRTPLLSAIRLWHHEIILALIKANASVVNESDTFNWTPLHYASFEGLANVISQLLDCDADAFARDNEGYSPLHLAVIQNKLDAISVFINETPECLNEKDSNEMTPLLLALQMDHQEIAIAFIKSDATLANETDVFKRTPLHYASIKGFGNVISQLLASGANPFAKDNDGYNPLHLAIVENKLDVVKLFIDKKSKCLNDEDSKGRSPLFLAIYERQLEIAIALTKVNVLDVNKRHTFQRTSLHWASINGWSDVISQLLNSGANAIYKDSYGYTPLHLAVIQNNLDAVRVFIDEDPGCLNELDNNGRTPLLIAEDMEHEEIALALMNTDDFVVNESYA